MNASIQLQERGLRNRRWTYLLLTAFTTLLFFLGLGDRDLLSSHEGRAAQNAQLILDEGSWGLPRLFDGQVELQKPPLYYWLVACLGWLRGGQVDAWCVRFPAALSGLLCVLFLAWLGVKAGRPRAGLFAAAILATCVHFTWLARVGRIDMPLTLAVTVALGCLEIGRADGWRWQVAGFTALAVGVMLKGPIALVLVGIVELGQRLFRVRAPGIEDSSRGLPWLWGAPLVLLLAGPWFLWANAVTDNRLFDVFFWYHNVERGLGSESLQAHPWWFYIPRAFVDLLPWSLAPPLLVLGTRGGFDASPTGSSFPPRWGLIWFGTILLFLTCMRFKRADYLLPAYPGAAWFLGCWLDSVGGIPKRMLQFGAALVLGGWGLFHHLALVREGEGYRPLAAAIREQTAGMVIFFRTEAHALAFHVGRPLDTILEWENLEAWANRTDGVVFIMPRAELQGLPPRVRLREICATVPRPTYHHQELVVLRSLE